MCTHERVKLTTEQSSAESDGQDFYTTADIIRVSPLLCVKSGLTVLFREKKSKSFVMKNNQFPIETRLTLWIALTLMTTDLIIF